MQGFLPGVFKESERQVHIRSNVSVPAAGFPAAE